ncbi:MAG: preprotein translocase subunit SecG [Clostridia bacterium]|nr:preprotein translocase subunit SecG [Clostridia bacterium]MBQ8792281.1 preprotein translocase subunit SecG [Clostridia bacterium]
MNKSTLLAIASDFSTTVLPVIRYVLFGVIIASAIVLIITTLLQANSSDNSLDAFTGAKQESYYSQNKGASRDAILKRITIAMAIVIAVCILAFFITELVAGYEA